LRAKRRQSAEKSYRRARTRRENDERKSLDVRGESIDLHSAAVFTPTAEGVLRRH
jgi:hypothetical protein